MLRRVAIHAPDAIVFVASKAARAFFCTADFFMLAISESLIPSVDIPFIANFSASYSLCSFTADPLTFSLFSVLSTLSILL